jgi:hypothetical protein
MDTIKCAGCKVNTVVRVRPVIRANAFTSSWTSSLLTYCPICKRWHRHAPASSPDSPDFGITSVHAYRRGRRVLLLNGGQFHDEWGYDQLGKSNARPPWFTFTVTANAVLRRAQ